MVKLFSLRTTALATLMAIPITALGTAVALAGDIVFPIENGTSASIIEFYISPVVYDGWGDNVVPAGSSLPPGGIVDMRVEDGEDFCQYNMFAVFDDGVNVESLDVNVCEIDSWVYSDN